MLKKTKIICTQGPATEKPGVVDALIENGMNLARFNFSHGDHAEHLRRINMVREAAKKAGKVISLVLDTKGPEMRLGEFKNGRRDESVIFSMQTFVVKLASGVAALVAAICLTVFNIQEQSDVDMTLAVLLDKVGSIKSNIVETIDTGAVFGLRMVMTLAPIAVLVIALLVFRAKYILTDKKLEEISGELKSRS